MKKFIVYSYLLFLFIASIFFYYYLPKKEKIYVVGTEIKREVRNNENQGDLLKDVRYVVARNFENGNTIMFRNEDMPWPPYFKFDSGSLSGKVMNYQKHEKDTLFLATYYGWRIPFFSMYPNLTKIKEIQENHKSKAWFNIIFLSLFYLAALFIFILLLKAFKRQN